MDHIGLVICNVLLRVFSSLPSFIQQINGMDFLSLDVLLVAFNAGFTLSRLNFYRQLLGQLSVALLSRLICLFFRVTHCYCYTLGK